MVKLNNAFNSTQQTGFQANTAQNQPNQFQSNQSPPNQVPFQEQSASNQAQFKSNQASQKGLFQIPEKFLQLIP